MRYDEYIKDGWKTIIPFNESFIVATEDEKIIGVLGFDADLIAIVLKYGGGRS